jgi:hypothetical protein
MNRLNGKLHSDKQLTFVQKLMNCIQWVCGNEQFTGMLVFKDEAQDALFKDPVRTAL